MVIRKLCGNISLLQPIIRSWISECKAEEMGIELDEDVYLNDLERLIVNDDSDLLVLEKDNKIVGFMGMRIFDSPLGRQRIANEHYFYVLPEYRGISSLRFIRAAEKWAKVKGCSNLMMNASAMASSLYPKVCALYKKLDFQEFEKTYIKSI